MQDDADMSKAKKRTRITPDKNAPSTITVQEKLREKNGVHWTTYLVQGWKENGKWQRKQFKDKTKAESHAAIKRVQMENQGRNQNMILTPLTEDQAKQAVDAFDRLSGTYSLSQAIDFFLKNHRPPEYVTTIKNAINHFIEDKERDGLRPRTLRGIKGTLNAFADATDNPEIHTVTTQTVEAYLRGLRAVDGKSPAKRKSWNTHRNDLSQFFAWSMIADLATNRPWCFTNPVEGVRVFTAQQVAEQRPPKATTSPDDLQKMLSVLMRYRGGIFVKVFVLSYFAGIRPCTKSGEILKLAAREKELINLKTGMISIPAAISKTKEDRQVMISKNLTSWLKEYSKFPIIPKIQNFDDHFSMVRTHFGLKRDETRHSFISYHVGVHRSIGDAALQAGNSESMVRKHYLNLHTREEGEAFFSLVPDLKARRAIIDESAKPEPQSLLRAV
ncbi:MAG: tyrosine-type recombinase/integrase [Akkermansiaceae bacterium]